jgi:hypothetical protein
MRIHHHLGLGDHFVCYGLVRSLQDKYGGVEVFAKSNNYNSVVSMYDGTGINVIRVNSDDECISDLKIGFNDTTMTENIFGEEFYRQAGVPYENRWKYEIKKYNAPIQKKIPIFVHDDIGRGYSIKVDGFRPYLTDNIFDWSYAIENADEVHCIESSFRLMIDFLKPKGKLFLHFNEEKSFRIVPTKHKWIVI